MSVSERKSTYARTKAEVGYIPRSQATPDTYAALGFKSGLEIHQQLKTQKKLFCRCPAGRYQHDEYDAEIIRHMRPTLSELGEYDGTALMEFKTRKNIIYRLRYETACTYDIDDTPPFALNREALGIALEIALLLGMKVVGELHITRKQYLDGSIPTGFQRTGIISIEGSIPLTHKTVRLIQLSIEEDACREVSDQGHWRIYTTDRLGMPLIEMVTYPDMTTPDEVAEAAQYLRYVARSSGKVRTGIGAGREDVNVSVAGGTRVEIKGVSRIRWIPELVHNEAFRQKSLLMIRDLLQKLIPKKETWQLSSREIDASRFVSLPDAMKNATAEGMATVAVNLPQFAGILSHFTQPGRTFADELSDRLKVIACIEKPNMVYADGDESALAEDDLRFIRKLLGTTDNDGLVVFWGPKDDVKTAVETIDERCRLAMVGVPGETRKALPSGVNVFERVLPGPDRMYPDTDSAPISITQPMIEDAGRALPMAIDARMKQLSDWRVPADTHRYIFKRNLAGLLERIVIDFDEDPVFVGSVIGHTLRRLEGVHRKSNGFRYEQVYELFRFVKQRRLFDEIIKEMLKILYAHPHMDFESILIILEFKPQTMEQLQVFVPALRRKFDGIRRSKDPLAEVRWIMANLRKMAIGNVCLEELSQTIERTVLNGR